MSVEAVSRPFLFSPWHLAFLGAIAGSGALVTLIARRRPALRHPLRRGLGGSIAAVELLWYVYAIRQGWFQPPEGLPLHLCDLTLWLTVLALWTLRQRAFELAYFWGLVGTSMALLTPDLPGGALSYPVCQFFLSHGLVIVAILFLAGSGLMAPRPRTFWMAYRFLLGYVGVLLAFNAIFGTNYMYLLKKPAHPSLLDWMGSWPLYIAVAAAAALGLFAALERLAGRLNRESE